MDSARANPELRASYNQGKPPIAATDKPNSFKGNNVVAADQAGAPYRAPTPVHAKDLPPHPRPTAPSGGNAEQNQKYQQQQELYAKQEKEHQQLMQQQETEHQKAAQQHASQQQMQEMELRHQQQTQQMEAHHYQQQQLQMHQAPPPQSHGGQKPPK